MPLFAIPFPGIDPVAVNLGPIDIKWYGIAYMAGLLLGWLYVRQLLTNVAIWNGTPPFTPEKVDDLLLYIIAGVMIGGRLGSILFYEPAYYFQNPDKILAFREGGMSFHGALLGCGAAIWAFSWRNGTKVLSAMDLCAAAVPIGLFFGRVANFVNGEVFGRPTEMPWGMVFPTVVKTYPEFQSIEPTPRHPSQLYEAFFEGIVLFLVLRFLTHRFGALQSPGLVVGVFLVGYGLARSFCELFRQPDPDHVLTVGLLTPGMVYSLPMIALGAWFIVRARRQPTSEVRAA